MQVFSCAPSSAMASERISPAHSFPGVTTSLMTPRRPEMVKRTVAGIALGLLIAAATSYAGSNSIGSTGVTLYEISERVTFDPDPGAPGVMLRNATAPLQGFAELGTSLCPSQLLVSVPRIESCTVIATGQDSVSITTGLGPVVGTFDVVVNAPGNSSVHVPDMPVISGTFSGQVDLSLAVLYRVPLGTIRGIFTITHMADPSNGQLVSLAEPVVVPFYGTFRMPFGVAAGGQWVRSNRKNPAFYLADDMRT